MKLSLWYEIVDSEQKARDICERENRAHPRRIAKHRAHYTPWNHPEAPNHFIVWFYVWR